MIKDSIKSSLETIVNDLTSIEVASIGENDDNENKSLLAYSQVQIEGDSVNWVTSLSVEEKGRVIELHRKVVGTSQVGRMALISFAISVLKSIT